MQASFETSARRATLRLVSSSLLKCLLRFALSLSLSLAYLILPSRRARVYSSQLSLSLSLSYTTYIYMYILVSCFLLLLLLLIMSCSTSISVALPSGARKIEKEIFFAASYAYIYLCRSRSPSSVLYSGPNFLTNIKGPTHSFGESHYIVVAAIYWWAASAYSIQGKRAQLTPRELFFLFPFPFSLPSTWNCSIDEWLIEHEKVLLARSIFFSQLLHF